VNPETYLGPENAFFGRKGMGGISFRESEKSSANSVVASSQMNGRMLEISLACAATMLPMGALIAALLLLVYQNLLPGTDQSQSFAEPYEAGVYVDYSATRLAFMSSWISTLGAYLSILLMTLSSFSVAR
jgi:hypothetical protein